MHRGVNLDLRERLAAEQHAIWAHWMRYLFSVAQPNDDGSYTIPPDKAARWLRQLATDYADLSPTEQASDREQADRVLECLARWAAATRE